MSEVERLADESVKWIKALTKEEEEVFNYLIDYLDTLPAGYFADHTVAQLNKHFGGEGDFRVTEGVRRALDAQQRFELMLEEMGDVFDDLPEDDEDEEEEED